MGNVLILYDSKSGNTRKMAEYIKKGSMKNSKINVRIRSIDEASKNDILWCNGIAVGSPTNMGTISWKMKKFWDDLGKELWGNIDGKIGCAFSSSGGWGGGAELTCQSIMTVFINYGFLVFGVPDYVANKFTLHYGSVVAGEPIEQKEIDSCFLLGEKLSHWVEIYFG